MRQNDREFPRVALQVERNRAHGRALLKGIADYALEKTDWRLELVDPAKLTDASYVRQFDGLIVRVMDDATADALVRARKPTVDTYGRTDDNRLESIRLDDGAIAETAFRCFKERHYGSFGYCGFGGLRFSDARGSAFGALAEENGCGFSAYGGTARHRITDKFFRDEKTEVLDAEALGEWLRALPKPTAVFCCNDLRAVQVLRICEDVGLSVPRDVAVMGVDNDVLLCTFSKPSLSSIDTDPFALGRRAAQMLDEQMGSPCRRKRRSVLHAPKRVVERLSTESYSFKTPWLGEAVGYIRRNLAKGVTANDVVRHVGCSHPTVNKAFADELGHAVKREIIIQRSRLACAMLSGTRIPTGEIAMRCGYRSPQYFTSQFSEEYGTAPDAWRKAFQKTKAYFQ